MNCTYADFSQSSKRMFRMRRTWLRAIAFIVALVLPALGWATTYSDCFEVEFYGDIRHVACTIDGLTDIHYAVDRFKTNDWEVVCHGGGTESRIVKAQPGEHILTDNVFTNNSPAISGAAYPFVFEFYNWYKIGTSGKTWYGYVSLGLDENAEHGANPQPCVQWMLCVDSSLRSLRDNNRGRGFPARMHNNPIRPVSRSCQ